MDTLTVSDIEKYKEIRAAMDVRAAEIIKYGYLGKDACLFDVDIDKQEVIIQFEDNYYNESDVDSIRMPVESFIGDYPAYFKHQEEIREAERIAWLEAEEKRRIASILQAKSRDMERLKELCHKHPAEARQFVAEAQVKVEGQ